MSPRGLIWVLALASASCATYQDQLRSVHEDFYAGRLAQAEAGLRDQLDGAGPANTTLLDLELATVLQARGRYADAAGLLSAADDHLEVLDYSSAPLDDLVHFAFAVDDVWRASPPERVMINTQNMINYLGAGQLEDAAVEARRLIVLLSQSDVSEEERYANAFGWGLAAVVLAARGKVEEAQDAFSQLAEDSGLRPPADRSGLGTILVVCQLGRAPIRRQARYWISTGGPPHQLNIPVMQRRPGGASAASVALDGEDRGQVPLLFDLGEQLMRRYKDEFPRLLAAAITQVIPRALGGKVVGKAAETAVAGKGEKKDEGKAAMAKLVGSVVGFLTETAVAMTQVADVRCWSLLPGRYGVLRLDVPPGVHSVTVTLVGGGSPRRLQLDVSPGELALVNVVSGPGDGYRTYPEPRGRDVTDEPAGLAALALLDQAAGLTSDFN